MKQKLVISLRLMLYLLVVSVFWVCCTKNETKYTDKENPDPLIKHTQTSFRLPVNLSKYNLLNFGKLDTIQTKNTLTETYNLKIDSLLDNRKAYQESSPNGIVYTQIPFKINDSSINGAISSSISKLKESIVPIKCFYIIFEDCINQYKLEYIVTMIPSKTQLSKRSDYTFLYKPNFDGIIIYSKADGEYIGLQILENGLIEQGKLLTEMENNTLETTYIEFYIPVTIPTKNDFPMQHLDAITVVAVKVQGKLIIIPDFSSLDIGLQEVIREKEAKMSGGGKIDPPSNEFELVFLASGCRRSEVRAKYTKYSEITLRAPLGEDGCIFLCWIEDGFYISNSPLVTISLNKDKTIKAQYVSKDDKECYKLAQITGDSILMQHIEKIRGKINTGIEYAFSKRKDGSYIEYKGVQGRVESKREFGVSYLNHFHCHSTGKTPFTSATDLITLRDMVINGWTPDVSKFIYGTIADNKILCLGIKDYSKFIKYFNDISKDEASLKSKFYDIYEKMFIENIQELKEDELYELYTKIMDSMGISVFFGRSFEGDYSNIITKWESLEIVSGTSNFNINSCLK